MTRKLLFLSVAVAWGQSAPSFEATAFCKKYHCVRTGPPEAVKLDGGGKGYVSNYRALAFQIDIRRTAGGKRANPFMIVRWVPAYSLKEKDVVGVSDLVRETTGASDFDAAKFVLDFWASKPNAGDGPSVQVGNFDVRCSYTPPKDPRIELIVEERAAASIGSATMMADGTIVLTLRAEGPGGTVGDGRLTYPKSHPEYQKILAHLGGLKPGESKSVAPWPE